MATAYFRDKIGKVEVLPVEEGQPLADVLRRAGIPRNAVLSRINGNLVSEETAVVGPADVLEFTQVRHYDMGVSRAPRRVVYPAPSPVYTKSVIFDERGRLEVRSEQLDASAFPEYVDETFVKSVASAGTIAAGDQLLLGLSGGRDSVAFLKLLERTSDRLPPFSLTAVTITGLPDWEEPATFGAAIDACRRLDMRHHIVTASDVEEVFKLRSSFVETMNRVVASDRSSMTMVIGHHVLRRLLEVTAARQGLSTIAWGFNADDLLASLVTWWMSGFRMGALPVRFIGNFRFVFPLYRITKKELTIYLELVAPEWNRQGSPGRFTSGPDERSMSYAIADHLLDLWPGIDHYAFTAFENMQRQLVVAE